MALVMLRTAWALLQAHRRPPELSAATGWGHRLIYAMMWAVPVIALIRQYGSGKAFSPFGVPLMRQGGDKIEWMIQLGGLLHGELGWALLILVVGHVGMALWHRRSGGTDVLARMID